MAAPSIGWYHGSGYVAPYRPVVTVAPKYKKKDKDKTLGEELEQTEDDLTATDDAYGLETVPDKAARVAGLAATGVASPVISGAAEDYDYYIATGTTDGLASSVIASKKVYVEAGGELTLTLVNVRNNKSTNISLDVSKLSGSGTIVLHPQTLDVTVTNPTSNMGNITYKSVASMAFNGTLVFDGSIQHIFSSSTASGSFREVDGKYADFHLLAEPSGVSGKGLSVGVYTETSALNIGNLSGEAGSHILGYGNGTAHYLSVHQTEDTVFAGVADNTSGKPLSILKNGNGTLVLTGANESKGDLKVSEGMVILAGADGKWAGNISIGKNGTLAYAGAAVADGGASGVKKTSSFTDFTSDAAGTLEVLGQSTVAGTGFAAGKLMVNTDINAGKVVVDEGGQLIVGDPESANNGILTVGATMEINGTLTVNSKIQVTDMANLEREGGGVVYSDPKAESAGIVDFGNGYGKSVYVLYRGSGTVTGLTKVYLEGTGDEYEVGTAGKVWVAESVGRYCINKGTVVYGDDRNSAADEVNTKTLVLNGGILELAQDLKTMHSINLAQDSTMIIDAGVVVKDSQINDISSTLTIIGAGTYDLGTGAVAKTLADSINPNVQFGSGWTGSVRVSGLELGGGDNAIRNLYGLDHGNGWVEIMDGKGYLDGRKLVLRDIYGPGEVIDEDEDGNPIYGPDQIVDHEYVPDTDTSIALNMRLTGRNALVINTSDYDELGHDTTFTGKMAGTGDLVVTSCGTFNAAEDSFIFTGDVSAWTGNFILEHNAAELNGTNVAGWAESKGVKLVKFTGPGDVNVNFSVTHTGDNTNSMNVEIAGDAARSVGSDFSHGEGDTLDLTLTGAGAKTFTGDVDVTTLTATGAQATFGGTLAADTLEVGTAEAAGTLVLGGTSTLNTVRVNNGSLSFAEGAVINANGEFYVADGLTAGGTNAVTFNGGAGFIKTGAGTLELTGTASFTAAAVREGTLKLDTQGNHTYTNISLGHSEDGVDTVGTLVINNTAAHADADTMTGLALNHDAELQVIGAGARATLDSTVLNGNTLTLRDSHTAEGILSAYYFTGSSAGEGTFVISQDPAATPANVAVTIKGAETFRDAVIRFDEAPAGGVNTLAVGADNVKVAALQGTGDSLYLISRESFEAAGTDLTTSSPATRTLTITGNGETNTFSGTLGANLNIVMAGSGTQIFSGDASALSGDIIVNAGSMEFTSAVGSETAPLTSIAVNAGSLDLVGGYTQDLTVAGTLNLTADTLTVNGTLRVENGSTLNITGASTGLVLGQHYVLDLEGLTSTEVEEGVFAYQLFTAATAAKVTGISNGEIDMSHVRANGIGWSAEYTDGLLTLTRMKIVVWNSPGQATATWTPDSNEFVDEETIGPDGKANVKVATNLEATIGRSVVVQSLGVNENISLTLTGADDEKTFTFKDINLEEGATLDASGVNLILRVRDNNNQPIIPTVDLSAGSTFITKAVTGGVYTGTGTVQIGFEAGTGTVTMGEGSQFRGLVDVTSGTVALGTSNISGGTWQLEAGVNGVVSGTAGNNIILVGSNHTLTAADAATIAGDISGTGAGFTKAGEGNLTLSGTADLATLTVSDGTVTIAGKATLGDLTVDTGAGLATTSTANLIINGTLSNAEELTVSTGLFTMGAASAKAGEGTLVVTDGATFSATGLAINEGAVQFNTGNTTGAAIELGNVSMAAGTKLIQSGSVENAATHRQVHVDSLSLTGDASIEGAQDNGHFVIGNTTLGGNTLTLNAAGDSDAWAVYQLTGPQNAADAASAVAVSGKANTQLSISDGAALGKSTLTLSNPGNSRTGVMALAADNVQTLGVSGGSSWKLVSNAGVAAGSNSNGVDALAGDGTVRTLTLTGNGGDFAGTIGRNVNIVMSGDGGIQKFTGDATAMSGSITVERGELSFSNALATGNTVTLNGGTLKLGADSSFASISGAAGSALYTTTGETYTMTLTGEGGNFAGTMDKMNITLASSATGTHEFSGSTPGNFDKLTIEGGTLTLAKGGTVGTLTMTGGGIDASGELAVTKIAVTGGEINRTAIVYVGTEGEAILGAKMTDASLEVAENAGAITLNGADKTFTDLTIRRSFRTTDDILLDADVTVSGSINLDEGAQIGFGDNHQLFYQGFTYTTDSDSDTHGTISKTGEGNVTATNLRIMRKDSEDAAIDFTLKNVRLVNGAGAGNTTLTATGNELSDIVVTSGKVILLEDTEVTNDVTLAVGSAQLEVATGKTLTNGVITMTSRDSSNLLLDNDTAAASVFHGGLEGSSAIIENAAVTVVVPADAEESYTWGAKLVGSTLDLTGDLYLSNSNQHTLAALTIAKDSTLTFKNGSTLSMPGDIRYAASLGKADATISNNGTATAEVSIGNAAITFSNTAITITQDPGVSFLAGAKNVDLVMNYNGDVTSELLIEAGAGREGERSFHDIVLTNGDVILADNVTLTGDLNIANGNYLYINRGKQLVSDGGVICIEGVGQEGEEHATIDFDHGYVHGADYSRLNGASASVKVTGAEVTLTNSGTDTYVWRAALSESSLTTTGDVTLNYDNNKIKITHKLTDLNVISGTTTLKDDVEISGVAMLGAGAKLVENQYNSITDGYIVIYNDNYNGSTITNGTGSAASVFGNNGVANQGVSISLAQVTLHSGNTYTWGAAFDRGVELSIGVKGQDPAHLTLTNTSTTHTFSDIQFAKSSTLTLKNGVSMYYKNLSSWGVMLTEANIEGKDATIKNRRDFYGSSGNEGYIKGYTGLLLQDATLTLFAGGTLYMPVSNVDLVVTKDPSIDKIGTTVLTIDYTTAQNEDFGYDGRELEFRNIKVLNGGEVCIGTHSITVSQNVEIAAGSYMTINGDGGGLHKDATIFKSDGLSTTIYVNDGDRGHSLIVDNKILTITGKKDFTGDSGKAALDPESNVIATVITQDGEGTSSLLAGADATAKVLWADISLNNTEEGADPYVWGAYLVDSTLKVAGTADLTNAKGAKLSDLRVGFYDEEEPDADGYNSIYKVKNFKVTEQTADADLTVRGKLLVDTVTVRERSKLTAAGGATINDYVDAHGETTFGNATSRTTTEGSGSSMRPVTVDAGGTLHAINSPLYHLAISRAEAEGATGSINLDLVGGAPLGSNVSTAIAGKVKDQESSPGSLKALMNDCSLSNADVVVSGSGAIDAAARADGDYWFKEFTMNVFDNVTIGDNVTISLAGMENYYDIVLHISTVETASSGASGQPLISRADSSNVVHIDYDGTYNLSENYHGQVVDVWVSFGVPEPTTGTLSVLALAALAARRRRR